MLLGIAMSLPDPAKIALSIALAFLFGYALTMTPLLRAGMPFEPATRLALASDPLTIAAMEIVDNAAMLVIPGAKEAGPAEPLFWGSLVSSLVVAGLAAFPVSRWLISRGRGHAVVQGVKVFGHGPHHADH